MIFTIETHHDRTFVDPTIEVHSTIDLPRTQMFQTNVIITDETGEYFHALPQSPYVNGTWTDDDVQNAIDSYFESIAQ